jgi:uracil-DNA glycosylase
MRLEYGRPFTGKALEELTRFLGACGLAYDQGVQFSVCLYDD